MKIIHIVLGLAACGGAIFLMKSPAAQEQVAEATQEITTEGKTGDFFKAIKKATGPQQLGGVNPASVTDPLKMRRAEFYGYNVRNPAIIGKDNALYLVQNVIADYPFGVEPPQPASYQTIEFNPTCTPRKPKTGEKIANVHIGGSDLETGIHVYSEAELATRARGWVSQIAMKNKGLDSKPRTKFPRADMTNVVLTDTSAPLYVVLQHKWLKHVWNLHVADGVQIAHIVMVGSEGTGINAPQGDFQIEAINAYSSCGVIPSRKPAPHWGLYEQKKQGILSRNDEYEPRAIEAAAAYDTWFQKAFGQPSETGAVGAYSADHVLVGPAPATADARVPYNRITGSTIKITPSDYVVVGNSDEMKQKHRDMQRELALMVTGGDLSMLNPDAMERTQ